MTKQLGSQLLYKGSKEALLRHALERFKTLQSTFGSFDSFDRFDSFDSFDRKQIVSRGAAQVIIHPKNQWSNEPPWPYCVTY